MFDDLGDRIKTYEEVETTCRFDKSLPLYARLDGRGFSKFTKHMRRPYDIDMASWMIETAKYLVKNTGASIGYTQSDEISLVWASCVNELEQLMFDGKKLKLTSVLASMCTAKFMSMLPPHLVQMLPHFDCRIFNLPSQTEAINTLIWRENDARKNSVSMLARSVFSHKELHKKSSKEVIVMMTEKNVSLLDYPVHFQRGIYVKREVFEKELDEALLASIPFVKRPIGPITRSEIVTKEFALVELKNRNEVVFA